MSRLLLLAAVIALFLGACTYAQDPAPYRPSGLLAKDETAETGGELYARDCAWCHGDRGGGTPRGPDLVSDPNGPAFTDFMLRTGRMPIDSVEERVRYGPPAYTEEEIDALVEHVASLGGPGPDIPHPDPEAGDLEEGATLYLENCAACHSSTGIGGTLAEGRRVSGEVGRRAGFQVPGVGSSTPREIAEAMLVGPGTMPVFGERTFTEAEIDSIVRYVLHVQDPGNRGGADIGRIGPVAEGAVAWVVGIGAMLVIARWIGTRRETG